MGHIAVGWPHLGGWHALVMLLGGTLLVTTALVLTRNINDRQIGDRQIGDQMVEDRPIGFRRRSDTSPTWPLD